PGRRADGGLRRSGVAQPGRRGVLLRARERRRARPHALVAAPADARPVLRDLWPRLRRLEAWRDWRPMAAPLDARTRRARRVAREGVPPPRQGKAAEEDDGRQETRAAESQGRPARVGALSYRSGRDGEVGGTDAGVSAIEIGIDAPLAVERIRDDPRP